MAHVRQATKLAGQYQVSVWTEGGRWYGRCVEMPNCMGDGKSADACVSAVREAVVAGLSADLDDGMDAPAPQIAAARRKRAG